VWLNKRGCWLLSLELKAYELWRWPGLSRLDVVILFTRHTSSPTNRFSIHCSSNISSSFCASLAIRTRTYRNQHGWDIVWGVEFWKLSFKAQMFCFRLRDERFFS
jgi:hypothetical protein